MNKVYESPRLSLTAFDVKDLVTTSLGYELGQDKSWYANPWDANIWEGQQ